MNKLPKEYLDEQYQAINFAISKKEKELQELSNPTKFVLNKDISKIIDELKSLNSQRATIIKMLENAEE